jgi:hypothetical protein
MPGTNESLLKIATHNLALITALSLSAAGCAKEKTASAAAADLEKTFQTAPSTPSETPEQPSASSAPPGDQAKQLVRQAVSALQTNGYAVAFATLRAAQTAPNITVDQYDAIEKARLAVEREMANKAVAGDPNALQSLHTVQSLGH